MIIKKIILEEFSESSSDTFHKNFNLITSLDRNSVGKSTYCRLIFYGLGYTIPSTEGMSFDKINTTIYLESNNKNYVIKRSYRLLTVGSEDNSLKRDYTLPEEHVSFVSFLFGVENLRIADNLLGLMYIDQEKGWTLLNRGKVIGNNRFSIDELVAALKNIDCEELFLARDSLENEIEKYQALLNMNSIKEEYYENNNNLEIVTLGEDIKKKIASLQLSIQSIKHQIEEIDKVIKQDKSFFEYIEAMSLYVKTNDGLIKVTKDNIENSCNIDYLKAEKALLKNQLSRLEAEKFKLQKDYDILLDGENLFGNSPMIDAEKNINKALSSINIDVEQIKILLNKSLKEKAAIKAQIRSKIRLNNEYITQIFDLFFEYAKRLNVEKQISNKVDYIFTDNLKGKTGALFQKLIIAYKVATIKVVEQAIGAKLFLVIDSPKAKELDEKNTKQIMEFLKTELSENQVIMASIFSDVDLFIGFDKVIEFNNKAIEKREQTVEV